MSGIVDSAGGFLGLSDGPKAPGVKSTNQGLSQLNAQNNVYDHSSGAALQDLLSNYGSGKGDLSSTTSGIGSLFGSGSQGENSGSEMTGALNALATGPMSGSRFATDQVQSNPLLSGLFGNGGALNEAEGKLHDLNNQGFNLTPGDNTLYGQESGQIANQFGQQGNDVANNLASRGLSNSGAAGAAFSGIQGNQNQMLAQAQQQIAQQRFQNTQNQITQQQNFVNSLGQQAGNDINQQYGRQISGVQNQTGQLATAAGQQGKDNSSTNQANMAVANFEQENKPQNAWDMAQGGVNGGMGAAGKTIGQGGGKAAATSMFGA